MKRLTKYDEFGNAEFVGIDNTKLYERLVCDETVALTIATNKLGEFEDVLEKWHIENLEGYIAALIETKNIAIEERNTTFRKYIKETIKTEELETELAELKQKAIVPKFERQSHIYGFAYGMIKPYVVVAYLDNIITLCEDTLSNTFEFCNNDYLVATLEEAEQKLAEIKGEKDEKNN